jgi:hypothetical protein
LKDRFLLNKLKWKKNEKNLLFIKNNQDSQQKWHAWDITFQFSFARTPNKIMRDALPSRGIPMVFLFKLKINHVKMIVVDDLLAN